jgi:hypothetical protein
MGAFPQTGHLQHMPRQMVVPQPGMFHSGLVWVPAGGQRSVMGAGKALSLVGCAIDGLIGEKLKSAAAVLTGTEI